MFLIKNYYKQIIKHDLINKFFYKRIYLTPNLNKLVLNFNHQSNNNKKIEHKSLAIKLLFLELIAEQKGFIKLIKNIIPSSKNKINQKYKPSCEIILKKIPMQKLVFRIVTNNLPEIKKFTEQHKNFKNYNKTETYIKLTDAVFFNKIDNKNTVIFKSLLSMNFSLLLTTKTSKEVFFLLTSYKF
jgi:ribosomal protein L5